MSIKNILLTIAGFGLLGVGAVGAFIPILPTTPFVLVASACLAGNPKIRGWLLKNKFFAEHLTNYRCRTGLKTRTVAVSLSFLWVTLCVSMLVMCEIWSTLLLSAVGIAVTIHLLCIARAKDQCPSGKHIEM